MRDTREPNQKGNGKAYRQHGGKLASLFTERPIRRMVRPPLANEAGGAADPRGNFAGFCRWWPLRRASIYTLGPPPRAHSFPYQAGGRPAIWLGPKFMGPL